MVQQRERTRDQSRAPVRGHSIFDDLIRWNNVGFTYGVAPSTKLRMGQPLRGEDM